MKFKHKRFGLDILRPVIPIEIKYGNVITPYEILVDSGADICIFNSQIAEVLGINLLKGIRVQVSGISGFPNDIYIHTISIKIGEEYYKTDVGFMQMSNTSYGAVGQRGFFDKFVVKFDLEKEDLELKPR